MNHWLEPDFMSNALLYETDSGYKLIQLLLLLESLQDMQIKTADLNL